MEFHKIKVDTDFIFRNNTPNIDYESLQNIGTTIHQEKLEEIKKLRELLADKPFWEKHPIKWNLLLLVIGGLITELIRLLIDIAKG